MDAKGQGGVWQSNQRYRGGAGGMRKRASVQGHAAATATARAPAAPLLLAPAVAE